MASGGIRAFPIVNLVMAALFLVSAALQWNDPDPWGWVALYVLSGVGCLVAARRPGAWILPAAACLFALVWALALAPQALPQLELSHVAESMKAETPAIETTRELLGLLIVAAWTAASAWVAFRESARTVPPHP